tara:strand:+ start:61503 stop:62282 length:780 start_codon:yes stop_codon:yes gene_type:complete
MKIGLLCNFYGFPEYTHQVLEPWLHREDVVIAASSFKYPELWDKNDTETSKQLLEIPVNFLAYGDQANDSFSRNAPLRYLKERNVDLIWILDQDEFYSAKEIEDTIQLVNNSKDNVVFRIEFKNCVGDKNHYIEGFNPPRIFRTKPSERYLMHEFYYENDINYVDVVRKELITYKSFSEKNISKDICNPIHYSWCGTEEYLKAKIEYQKKRYGGICSYKWEDDKLQFNQSYYEMIKEEPPELLEIEKCEPDFPAYEQTR